MFYANDFVLEWQERLLHIKSFEVLPVTFYYHCSCKLTVIRVYSYSDF